MVRHVTQHSVDGFLQTVWRELCGRRDGLGTSSGAAGVQLTRGCTSSSDDDVVGTFLDGLHTHGPHEKAFAGASVQTVVSLQIHLLFEVGGAHWSASSFRTRRHSARPCSSARRTHSSRAMVFTQPMRRYSSRCRARARRRCSPRSRSWARRWYIFIQLRIKGQVTTRAKPLDLQGPAGPLATIDPASHH